MTITCADADFCGELLIAAELAAKDHKENKGVKRNTSYLVAHRRRIATTYARQQPTLFEREKTKWYGVEKS